MFCPNCAAEYREGFTICADCKIPLVTEPPQKSNELENDKSKGIKVFGAILILLSFPAWFLAIIGGISNAYGLKTIEDKVTDLIMRFLFVGAPLGLLFIGFKLLDMENISLILGILELILFFLITFLHGIYWMGEGQDRIFGVICFSLGIFFLSTLIYLIKMLIREFITK